MTHVKKDFASFIDPLLKRQGICNCSWETHFSLNKKSGKFSACQSVQKILRVNTTLQVDRVDGKCKAVKTRSFLLFEFHFVCYFKRNKAPVPMTMSMTTLHLLWVSVHNHHLYHHHHHWLVRERERKRESKHQVFSTTGSRTHCYYSFLLLMPLEHILRALQT